jgi:hypothetical protein
MSLRTNMSAFSANLKALFAPVSFTETASPEADTLNKAFVSSQYLYKPPYGYPRNVDIPTLRLLAKSPYVFMVTQTIIDEIASVEWDVVPKETDEPDAVDGTEPDVVPGEEDHASKKTRLLAQIKEVKDWFYNPNGNEESFDFLMRAAVRDILEVDAGVWVKTFDHSGKFVQMFARDGGTFLKNPDIHGFMGNRAEYVYMPSFDSETAQHNYYESFLKVDAAYFQYGFVAMMPIPFGRREIVYMMRNPRSDSIYGRSPLEILYNTLQTLIYGQNYNLDYYTNNNMPEGVISLLNADKQTIQSFRERLEPQYRFTNDFGVKVKKFFKIPITNTEVNFVPFQLKPVDMQILEQQRWFCKLVWACFGVTASELGFTEDSNRATEFVQGKVFRRKTVRPLLNLIQYHINTQIMSEFGYDDLEFRFNDYDIAEDLERHKLWEMQLNNNIRTINEVREDLGLDPKPGGDDLKAPNPFAAMGQPNPNDPSQKDESKPPASSPFDPYAQQSPAQENKSIPVLPKKKESITAQVADTSDDIESFMRSIEQHVIKEIELIYSSNKLAEIKTFSDLWDRLTANLQKIVFPAELRHKIDAITKAAYVKGMEKSEVEFSQNFFPNDKALKFLQDYNFELVKNMNDDLANKLRATLKRAFLDNKDKTEVTQDVSSIFGSTIGRANTIVRTETNRAQNMGALEGAKQSRIVKAKSIINSNPESELCQRMIAKYGDTTIPLEAQFEDSVTGKSFLSPPFHPNCKTRIVTPRVRSED